MAKRMTEVVIEEVKKTKELKVWIDEEHHEALQQLDGVSRVYTSGSMGELNVYLDPRYERGEVLADIHALAEKVTKS